MSEIPVPPNHIVAISVWENLMSAIVKLDSMGVEVVNLVLEWSDQFDCDYEPELRVLLNKIKRSYDT